MLIGVAFCPQAPALVPEVGRGADVELAEVRAACRAAIRRVAPAGTATVVVGGADVTGTFGPRARGSFAGFGVDLTVPLGSDESGSDEPGSHEPALPPSLTVGAWLVRDALGPDSGAVGRAVAPTADPLDLPGRDFALIVLGDGSARRSEKAPGYLDDRAAARDAATTAALRSGDPAALRSDTTLDHDLLVAGGPAWNAVADALAGTGPWHADVLYDDAPLGVGYVVATWTA